MTEQQTITIEVDGKMLEAKAGQMLIEVTDAAGITVPRFCYHKHLSVAANCRMCLVEVENAPKPMPACATPCMDGMKVFTKSPLAREAQKGTMEFLLINHPLDCPICDQGGECELQDVAMGYGNDVSRFSERKRVVPDPDIGPLVATDMTRCIHCTRCVRFGDEIAGLRELGATGRGEHVKIGTYIKHAMASELSGNVIDLCPVGALTSKPFRFTARAWEMTQHETIAPHDSVGSNLYVHVRRGQVMRVVPRENAEINQTWISDRDRFSYAGLKHDDRLTAPMIRDRGQLKETSWEEALKKATDSISAFNASPDELMALVSPSATLEEMYLTQKLLRTIGSNNVDHRLRQVDFRGDAVDPQVSWLGTSLEELERIDAALLIGTNVRKEQPLINHRLHQAAQNGAAIMRINPAAYAANYKIQSDITVKPSAMLQALQGIASTVGVMKTDFEPSEESRQITEALRSATNAVVLIGNIAVSHPDYSLLRDLAATIAEATGSKFGIIPEAGNSVGAWLAGALPTRLVGGSVAETSGRNIASMIESPVNCALVVGFEPEYDSAQGESLLSSLKQSGTVIALSAYNSEGLMDVADVILPMSPFTETSGTFVNAQGDCQSFNGVVNPIGESRPGWKILRVLGNFLGLDGFAYESSEAVRDECLASCPDELPKVAVGQMNGQKVQLSAADIEAAPYVPAYSIDGIARRSSPLQATSDATLTIRLHPLTAKFNTFVDGDMVTLDGEGFSLTAAILLDDSVAEGVAVYPCVSGNAVWNNISLNRMAKETFA